MNPFETSEWTDIDSSSLITGVGVRDDDLVVRFKNGDVYLYPGLASHLGSVLGAESIGKYFHKEIRHQSCRKLNRE